VPAAAHPGRFAAAVAGDPGAHVQSIFSRSRAARGSANDLDDAHGVAAPGPLIAAAEGA
jgi:hypothetical protein